MWIISLKSLVNLLQNYFCFLFSFFSWEACGILASLPGIKPIPPALEGEVSTTGLSGRSCAISEHDQVFSLVPLLELIQLPLYLWMWNPQIERANCPAPFNIRDLSICEFWYLWGPLGPGLLRSQREDCGEWWLDFGGWVPRVESFTLPLTAVWPWAFSPPLCASVSITLKWWWCDLYHRVMWAFYKIIGVINKKN